MEWFSQKTTIAGVQVSYWMVVLGAIIAVFKQLGNPLESVSKVMKYERSDARAA